MKRRIKISPELKAWFGKWKSPELVEAVYRGKPAEVERLIKKGADPSMTMPGNAELDLIYYAAALTAKRSPAAPDGESDWKTMAALIQGGADLTRNYPWKSAFDDECEPNARWFSPYIWATERYDERDGTRGDLVHFERVWYCIAEHIDRRAMLETEMPPEFGMVIA